MQDMQVQSLGWEDHWKRKWQLTPVFLPGKSHGSRRALSPSPCRGSPLGLPFSSLSRGRGSPASSAPDAHSSQHRVVFGPGGPRNRARRLGPPPNPPRPQLPGSAHCPGLMGQNSGRCSKAGNCLYAKMPQALPIDQSPTLSHCMHCRGHGAQKPPPA